MKWQRGYVFFLNVTRLKRVEQFKFNAYIGEKKKKHRNWKK